MTYTDIQNRYKREFKKTISTCAIADAKRKLGYPVRSSPNRINPKKVKKPCTPKELNNMRKIL